MNACSRDVSNEEVMARRFRADPSYALEMLCDVLQAGEIGDIQVLLRHVSLAFGHAPSPEAEHSLDYLDSTFKCNTPSPYEVLPWNRPEPIPT